MGPIVQTCTYIVYRPVVTPDYSLTVPNLVLMVILTNSNVILSLTTHWHHMHIVHYLYMSIFYLQIHYFTSHTHTSPFCYSQNILSSNSALVLHKSLNLSECWFCLPSFSLHLTFFSWSFIEPWQKQNTRQKEQLMSQSGWRFTISVLFCNVRVISRACHEQLSRHSDYT